MLSGVPAFSSTGATASPTLPISPPPIPSLPRVGATPPSTPTATTRSGIAAAQPSVYGPPPDRPMISILSMPRVSAMVRRSSAKSMTLAYSCGVDEPIPGRSTPISRMWLCSA